jgi:hypothetical protein
MIAQVNSDARVVKAIRVTRRVCVKIAQNVAQPIFGQN